MIGFKRMKKVDEDEDAVGSNDSPVPFSGGSFHPSKCKKDDQRAAEKDGIDSSPECKGQANGAGNSCRSVFRFAVPLDAKQSQKSQHAREQLGIWKTGKPQINGAETEQQPG